MNEGTEGGRSWVGRTEPRDHWYHLAHPESFKAGSLQARLRGEVSFYRELTVLFLNCQVAWHSVVTAVITVKGCVVPSRCAL